MRSAGGGSVVGSHREPSCVDQPEAGSQRRGRREAARSRRRSARAMAWRAASTASGLIDIEVMPYSTRRRATSGRFGSRAVAGENPSLSPRFGQRSGGAALCRNRRGMGAAAFRCAVPAGFSVSGLESAERDTDHRACPGEGGGGTAVTRRLFGFVLLTVAMAAAASGGSDDPASLRRCSCISNSADRSASATARDHRSMFAPGA
jgi:hypothetical protein